VHSAYTDGKYIGYYNNILDAYLVFDEYFDDSIAVIYTPASFPCLDLRCNVSKKLLEEKMVVNGELVYNKTWWGEVKQIYVN